MTTTALSDQLVDAWNQRRSDMRAAFHLATNVLQSISSDELTDELAQCHKILGYCYWRFSEFSLSMEHSLKALSYYQKTADLRGEADTLNSLGAVYMFQKQHDKRLECNLKCLEIRQLLGNADDISGSMNNIGETYLEAGDYASAKQWFYDCISYPGSTEDSLAWAYHNLGKLYLIEGNFSESESSFLKSLNLAESIKYEVLITETFLQLAELNKEEGFNERAKDWAEKALHLAQKTGAKEERKNAFFLLSSVKEKEGLFYEALNDYKNYHALFSEIHNESNIQRLKDLEFQYQLENIKKEAEIERLKTVDLKAAYDKIEQQKSLLELRNKEIVESIRYAQRIQQAVLKEEHHVSEHLPEHFIFYRPKDIVSGDFYWAQEKEGVLYVAAADCTGHGVPGGFLTMLGIAFLNEIISKNEIQTPAQILNELREKFIHELGLQDSTNDGMDITLVSLRYDEPTDSKELMWAGAYNPLWIVKNKGKVLNADFTPTLTIDQLSFYEVKPDKQPIGKSDYQADFTNHTLNLEKGDMLYLFSDGYQDQFGGEAGKKLKKSGFKELILSLAEKPLENQLSTMNEFFDSWKGAHEQVDDVCVIGIKL
jgi:serine phosphatase RsbU (regulator of sigma subunit)/tetratricopeptide (TPR) repeat protein